MALGVTLGILNGEKSRKYVSYDHHNASRTLMERARVEVKRIAGLAQLLKNYFVGRLAAKPAMIADQR